MLLRPLTLALLFAVVLLGGHRLFFTQDAGNRVELDHPYAAFLESRAFGAALGATAEFRKMEWVVIDPARRRLYLSMSEISEAMSDGAGDIAIDANPCGIVYVADLEADDSIRELRPLVIGGPYDAEAANHCDVDHIANPDGLAVDARGRLWIAEDTGSHINAALWVFDPAEESLRRFAAAPVGAELSGPYITGDGMLFFTSQHPDGASQPPFNAGVVVGVSDFDANADDFDPLPAPEGDRQRTLSIAAGEVQVIARSGDPIPGDAQGEVFGAVSRFDGSIQHISGSPDGVMWLPHGETGVLYVNYEGIPGGAARLNLERTPAGWRVIDGQMIDFGGVNGTWHNCGSSVTPWNTGLTSEEYEPYAGDYNSVAVMSENLGRAANPYDYGWIVELAPDGGGDRVVKRFAMGRFSHENAAVAGDRRTVYLSDDGSNVMLFRFVAARPDDLSEGTLYAARVTQFGGTGADHRFGLEWIVLGTAAEADIEVAIRALDPRS
ncbi:MAG: DUF839 domain-containing protein [Anaerolineae bacterium]|nr:DUF839 domain-containing protein [Anaerolineae bacterium]